MAKSKTAVVAKVAAPVAKPTSNSPYQLDAEQTLRASKALVRKIQSDEVTRTSSSSKANLLADADAEDAEDEVPIWLVLTTKKHIVDKKRLKPGKIQLPHPYVNTETSGEGAIRICLITADPQRKYKDMIAEPSFPVALSSKIQRVIGVEKIKSKYSSYESKRQLLGEYDIFLADDRVITYLPTLLGKPFYKSGSKRPIPVSLEGRRQNVDESGNKRRKLSEGGSKVTKVEPKPAEIAAEITKALSSALVHLAPSTTTAVKVGIASQTPAQIDANMKAVVDGLVDKYVPQKWKNVRAVHIKGPNTAALPIWLASELWADESEVLEDSAATAPVKKRKRGALTASDEAPPPSNIIEIPGPDGKMRRLEKPGSKTEAKLAALSDDVEPEPTLPSRRRKKSGGEVDVDAALAAAEKAKEKEEKAARKEALKMQKQVTRADAGAAEKATAAKKIAKKPRMKAADLI